MAGRIVVDDTGSTLAASALNTLAIPFEPKVTRCRLTPSNPRCKRQ
jgi:hypothetical protein